MNTINKVIAYALLFIAAALVVASFFKGAYLFVEACLYGILAMCFIDTSKKEKELEK